MDIAADALVIDSTTCQDFLERLANSSPQKNQPRNPAVRQLCIVEQDHHPLLPIFAERLEHGTMLLRRALPRVVALRVCAETSNCLRGTLHCITALASTLRHLHLYVGRNIPHLMIITALDSIRHRLPHLQSLDVEIDLAFASPGQVLDIALSTASLCSQLPSLSNLRLPLRLVEEALHHSPAMSPHLSRLRELSVFSSPHHTTPLSIAESTATVEPLRILRISASLAQCERIARALLRNLHTLHLGVENAVEPHALSRALRHILQHYSPPSSSHPSNPTPPFAMSATAVNSMFSPYGIPQPVSVSSLVDVHLDIRCGTLESAKWASFTPLLVAQNLEQLSIEHAFPLSYTEQDVLDMLGSWGKIHSLALNPRPRHGPASVHGLPPLGVLAAVARSGPCLRVFRALVDGSTIPSTLPRHTWAPSVAMLDLGHSVGSCTEADLGRGVAFIVGLFPGVRIQKEDCSGWVLGLGQRRATQSS